jgi:sulfonate transport system ATP-binding protein
VIVEAPEAEAPALDLVQRPVTVTARHVRRAFADRVVLDGLQLELRAGEFVALLGKSGCGKSTLLRAFAGLDADVEGEIDVPEERAVVFQDARLLPWKRVWRNVALGLPRADARRRADAALAEVGLTGHARAWPGTLSGGESQRVALARALVREPQLMLLDEPFGALDALTRIKMHALLVNLWRKHQPAVLLVTHDVDEAILLADRVLVLEDGNFSVDVPIDVPAPRRRGEAEFAAIRTSLLERLGVDEASEGRST